MSGWGPRVLISDGNSGAGNPDLPDAPFLEYGEFIVAGGGSNNLINYTTPGSNVVHLTRVEFGGKNIGDYRLLINDVVKARFVTWFNGPMDGFWDFTVEGFGGLPLAAGTNIKVQVNNDRSEMAEFFARIYGLVLDL